MKLSRKQKLWITCLIAGGAGILMSTVAQADWAYTHWGMTPDEVAAASGGRVKVLPKSSRSESEPGHWEIAAEGDFPDGKLTFRMGFMFDLKDGGLICVLMNAVGPDAEYLQARVNEQYGKPSKSSSFATSQSLAWRTPDQVEFTLGERPLAAVLTHCKAEQ